MTEHNSKEYYQLQSDFWFNENTKHMKECNAFRKQRDELINDMQEVKRKAKAFDEIVEILDENRWAVEQVINISSIVERYYKERT